MSTGSLLMNNHRAAIKQQGVCAVITYGLSTIVITARDELRIAHGRAEAATNFAL